jgi:hypothetical protein
MDLGGARPSKEAVKHKHKETQRNTILNQRTKIPGSPEMRPEAGPRTGKAKGDGVSGQRSAVSEYDVMKSTKLKNVAMTTTGVEIG